MTALLALRYRLLWAQVRLRRGKIVVFLAGYLLLGVVAALFLLGGFGAAVAAIRAGKAELVARIVLSGSCAAGILCSIILGAGVDAAFSEAALRRYPLTAVQRQTARHLIGILDPIWLLIIALDLGAAIGFPLLGTASLALTLPATLLLVASAYLLSRLIMSLLERLLALRSGPFLLLLLLTPLFFLPAMAPLLKGGGAPLAAMLSIGRLTPPFVAARVFAGASVMAGAGCLLFLLVCCMALALAVAALDRLPTRSHTVASAPAEWDGFADRVAAWFGPSMSPIAGKMLRYYLRSPQTRYNYPLAIPLCFFMLFSTMGRHAKPVEFFPVAAGMLAVLGQICTGAMSLNVFGFDGTGFRRYFLMPVAPAAVVRSASLVGALFGASLIPVALLLWGVFAPIHTDARMWAVLLSSAVGGLCLCHGLALVVSIYWAAPMAFAVTFGSRLPMPTMVVQMGTIFGGIFAPRAVKAATLMRYWWAAPIVMLLAIAFYALMLELGGQAFARRRERMLSVIEKGH